MKKSDLLKQSRAFAEHQAKPTAARIKQAISDDLAVVSDSYDIAAQALIILGQRLTAPDLSVKDLTKLITSHKELTASLIALRSEGRVTIRDHLAEPPHTEQLNSPAPVPAPLTPLSRLAGGGVEGMSTPEKISPEKSSGKEK